MPNNNLLYLPNYFFFSVSHYISKGGNDIKVVGSILLDSHKVGNFPPYVPRLCATLVLKLQIIHYSMSKF